MIQPNKGEKGEDYKHSKLICVQIKKLNYTIHWTTRVFAERGLYYRKLRWKHTTRCLISIGAMLRGAASVVCLVLFGFVWFLSSSMCHALHRLLTWCVRRLRWKTLALSIFVILLYLILNWSVEHKAGKLYGYVPRKWKPNLEACNFEEMCSGLAYWVSWNYESNFHFGALERAESYIRQLGFCIVKLFSKWDFLFQCIVIC